MKLFALLLILPAVAYGALIFGGADTAKRCGEVLVNGTVKDTAPDTDNCSQYYVCSIWFQSKMKCKSGKHFSATEKKCVDPCDAACDATLVCTTTSAPEISTETASTIPATEAVVSGSTAADVSPSTGAGNEGSTQTAAGSTKNDATDAPVTVTAAAATETDAPSTVKDAPIEDTTIAVEDTTITAEGTTLAAEERTAGTEAAASEDIAGRTSDESTETSTAFWQTIAKHFNQPPSTIPGLPGSVPE